MRDDITFTRTGFDQYLYWQSQDKRTLKKIDRLISSILRDGVMNGEGKPELSKYMPGYSREIDEKNRLIYDVKNDTLIIIACAGHYQDK